MNTNRPTLRRAVLSLCICACLLLSSCAPTSNFIPMLNAIVAAAQAALPILSLSGTIPAPVATAIGAYLNTVTAATSQTVTELDSADVASMQATKIAGYWSAAVLDSSVLANIPPQAQNLIRAIQASVNAFVAAIEAAKGGAVTAHASTREPIKLSWNDSRQLRGIRAHALQIQAQVAAH